MILEGLDVSNWQGRIDWHAVRASGKLYAQIKATEGLRYEDQWFPHNWQAAREQGMAIMAYHFFYDDTDPSEQARYMHNYVRSNGHFRHGDGIMLDLEEASLTGAGDTVNKARQFVLDCWYEINKPVILYTNYDTWVTRMGNPTDDVLAKCPLMWADIGPFIKPPENWKGQLSFWQYNTDGHVPGINGVVDLSRFYGSHKQLMEILHGVPTHA